MLLLEGAASRALREHTQRDALDAAFARAPLQGDLAHGRFVRGLPRGVLEGER
jgi:hypothetical protein